MTGTAATHTPSSVYSCDTVEYQERRFRLFVVAVFIDTTLFRALCAERKALRALYTAAQGPGWFEQGGWETNDTDLSAWFGVVCGEEGHVTSVHLPSNNLQGET